jgi:hypothetical protein
LYESDPCGKADLQAIAKKSVFHVASDGDAAAVAAAAAAAAASEVPEKDRDGKHGEGAPEGGGKKEEETTAAATPRGGSATPKVPAQDDDVGVPCPKYEDLRQICVLDACAVDFDACSTAEELKHTRAKLDILRSAGLQLVSSIVSSVRELKSAVAQAKKSKELSDAVSAKGSGGGKKAERAKAPASGLESMQALGKSIEHFPFEGFPENAPEWIKGDKVSDAVAPYMVTNVQWASTLLTSKTPVAASMTAFMADFTTSSLRDSTGRAMRKVADDENCDDAVMKDFLTTKVVPLQPAGSMHLAAVVGRGDKVDTVIAAIGLQNTAVKAGTVHVYVEKNNLWCGRVGVQGTRSVAITCATQLKEYMKGIGLSRMDPKTFFKDLRAEGISKYLAAGNTISHATVGPGDYLFVPAYNIVLEYASSNVDVMCLRAATLLARDQKGLAVFKAEADSPTTPANALCKAVMAQMST